MWGGGGGGGGGAIARDNIWYDLKYSNGLVVIIIIILEYVYSGTVLCSQIVGLFIASIVSCDFEKGTFIAPVWYRSSYRMLCCYGLWQCRTRFVVVIFAFFLFSRNVLIRIVVACRAAESCFSEIAAMKIYKHRLFTLCLI